MFTVEQLYHALEYNAKYLPDAVINNQLALESELEYAKEIDRLNAVLRVICEWESTDPAEQQLDAIKYYADSRRRHPK